MLDYSGGADFDFEMIVLSLWYSKITLFDKQSRWFVRIRECVYFTWENVKIHLRKIDHVDRRRYEVN